SFIHNNHFTKVYLKHTITLILSMNSPLTGFSFSTVSKYLLSSLSMALVTVFLCIINLFAISLLESPLLKYNSLIVSYIATFITSYTSRMFCLLNYIIREELVKVVHFFISSSSLLVHI